MITKRDLLLASAAGLAEVGMRSAQATEVAAGTTTGHDMSQVPASWMGKEQIAFLIYPEFTALDMVGPHAMLTGLLGATTHIVGKSRDVVKSDTGLAFQSSASFDECPLDLDIICVPGGATGTLAAMRDDSTLRFLKDRGSRAKFVTSVCTGSLLLGAAGLLTGYKATSHWAAVSLLPLFGATPSDDRIVRDRNRITAGGVTSGIDFGLSLVGQLRDRQYAECVQLMAQYAPEPPYNAGTPARAPVEVTKMMTDMFVDFNKQAETIGREVYPKYRDG
ncbi:DJ-1/PfpI family protein [Bradyrhizobium sp. HKCCYLS20291]|uniref:DJ-1/PfpI family protein n=1 Tax=Bradyrhizobium sp. HKCCYLS20291 TaxID=3420766 RepID=UPI003EBA8DC0